MSKYVKKLTRTFVRTEVTMDKYKEHLKLIKSGKKKSFLDRLEEITLKEFKYWIIVDNEFPYDVFAETNHLLFTKRKISFNWDNLNKKELEELNILKKGYLSENYDVIWENLPSGQTVPGHFHLQLIKMKREGF